jgi:CxxC motif-containing protein (DUF1111 family)
MTNETMLRAARIKLLLIVFLGSPLWVHSDLDLTTQGAEVFESRWVIPFLSSGSWGRGPHSNAESCTDCHHPGTNPFHVDANADEIHPIVLKIRNAKGTSGHKYYGNEISRFGIAGKLEPEGDFILNWQEIRIGPYEIRYPSPQITDLKFGSLKSVEAVSIRMGRDLNNLGALDSITAQQLQEIVNEQKKLGLNGRINYVIDPVTHKKSIGRYGYKASSPSLFDQISKAFRDELGVTSITYPINPCAAEREVCSTLNTVSGLEISEDKIMALTTFIRKPTQQNPPKPDIRRRAGKDLFIKIGCNQCHRSDLYAASEYQADTKNDRPLYTDLLIHDMGAGLADGVKEFLAGPQDWRTTPLSGIQKHLSSGGTLLHDGRAQSIQEAILWHDGEAKAVRKSYLSLNAEQKLLLEYFVNHL